LFFKTIPFKLKIADLLSLPDGTLGKETALVLKENNFEFIEAYEPHDFKHVLLNYAMTGLGEVRMQCFAMGNGNYYPPTWGIILLGAILFPHKLRLFYTDYKRGRQSVNITHWDFERLAQGNILFLRSVLNGR